MKNPLTETYKILETDAFTWLETAEGLRLSAELSWSALRDIWDESQTVAGVRERKLAYAASFMLLTAFAVENACRGIATLTKPTGWRYLADRGSGHDLTNTVPEFVSVSDAERDLLRRLVTYMLWAGRYLIPKKAHHYVAANELRLRTVRTDDMAIADGLFGKLRTALQITYDEI